MQPRYSYYICSAPYYIPASSAYHAEINKDVYCMTESLPEILADFIVEHNIDYAEAHISGTGLTHPVLTARSNRGWLVLDTIDYLERFIYC